MLLCGLRCGLLPGLLAVVFVAAPARSATIDEVSRVVLVSNFIDVSGVRTDDRSEGREVVAVGPFLEAAVDGVGFGDVANATGEALQDSNVEPLAGGGFRIEGSGSAGGVIDVNDPGFVSRAVSTADSSLSIAFSVDRASPFVLSVSLQAEILESSMFSSPSSLATEALAFARLVGAGGTVLFESMVSGMTAEDGADLRNESLEGVLEPGSYLFEIAAGSELRGFSDVAALSVAGFGLDFRVVPEPGTGLLLGLGLLLLPGAGRRSAG